MTIYATTDDIISFGRSLTADELAVAEALLPIVSAQLRVEADKVGKDLDAMIAANEDLGLIAKSVTVDVTVRALNQSSNTEPAMSQVSQSAGGYSVSGTYLVPGGGIFIKRAELARLGLRRQKYGVMEIYGHIDQGD